jgi:thiol-disulfide isomerase/thioredoxin
MKKPFSFRLVSLLIVAMVIGVAFASGCNKTPNPQKDKNWTQKAAATTTTTTTTEDNSRVKAVDFKLPTLKGQNIKLSGLLGKVVVINFFTTWCTYCKAEMPGFVDTMNKPKYKNVKFLFVDVSEVKNDVDKYIKQSNYKNVDPLLDTSGEVFTAYNGTGYPTTYIIDKTGHVAFLKIGEMDVKDLEKEIDGELNK